MKTILISIIVVALFILALAFGSQNQQVIEINYFIATGTFPLSTVLATVFFSGFIISWFIALLIVFRLKVKLKFMQNKLTKFQDAELNDKV